ncbi:unnamed protein product [Cuscuta epithymum]|uniref:mannosyl-glycoprotein endo-beta-N-acetylglucosaminidase n=1 Tax=Cuscuta epithymum TaxID=186058 RepID=A0AAV0EBY7_9ASTE|nr:unnamed protein product [Cuscuta epithymum]
MAEIRQSSNSADEPPTPPPFDPLIPSVPVSYALKTLEELESRSYFESFHFPFNKASVKLPAASSGLLPQRQRLLVCHDMAGGYGDDKWVQGGTNPNAYGIWHWYLMDVFVYFSHSLVALPPPCWTNTAHRHGVKVLGTFIMEWEEGKILAEKLLSTKESAFMYAERLTELAVALGFDGWLINLEVEIAVGQLPNLIDFVNHLTQAMHSSVPGSLVIWYDSVTTDGKLIWQDQLNEKNKPFFDVCDGIFVNYTWKETYPMESASVAGERKFDVYMGIDVFGRNTYGGGQWTTNVALDVIKKHNVSAAIFAPGWVYETNQPPDFQTAQTRWWGLVEKSWGISQTYPQVLPFYSNFDQGHGYHVFVDGVKVLDAPWNNISSQSFQPFLTSGEHTAENIQAFVDFKEGSYSGGGSITFRGTLDDSSHFKTKLFEGKLRLGESPLNFTYSVRSSGSSLLGLYLDLLSSNSEKKTSILLASGTDSLLTHNQLAKHFGSIIMPRHIKKAGLEPGWAVQESSITMEGYTLTEIGAVCYDIKKSFSGSSTEYSAVLGHISVTTDSSISPSIAPANSWVTESRYVQWSSDSKETRKLNMMLTWKQLEHVNIVGSSMQYKIYVKKINKLSDNEKEIYLGDAMVEAFYVSDLEIPDRVSSLKFIIQVSIDGILRKLEDSPYYWMDVQDSSYNYLCSPKKASSFV